MSVDKLELIIRQFILEAHVIETHPAWVKFRLGLLEIHRDIENRVGGLETHIANIDRYLNTPEYEDFAAGVVSEARHQLTVREEDDETKEPKDWFWTLGYLAGKALSAALAKDWQKAKHHIITSAALLNNWHRAILRAEKEPQHTKLTPEQEDRLMHFEPGMDS